MKVLFYGRLADMIGRQIEIEMTQPCSIAALRERIAAAHPAAAEAIGSERVRACVGDAIVADSHVVSLDETVEFLPPVSGG